MSATVFKPVPEVDDWFADQTKNAAHVNPCMRLYGEGPAGKTCKTCRLLFHTQRSKRYYKCELRNFTHGPGSDHRVNWPACGRFVEKVNNKETKEP